MPAIANNEKILVSRVLVSVDTDVGHHLRVDFLNKASSLDKEVTLWNCGYNTTTEQSVTNKNFDDYHKLSLGEKIKEAFENPNLQIKDKIKVDICVNSVFFEKTKLEKYLLE